MHEAVRNWVAWNLPRKKGLSIAEFGSLDVNGGVKDLLNEPHTYVGVDIVFGPNVDVVGDAAEFNKNGDSVFDVVLCLEVFEHDEKWRDLVQSAHRNLRPGGTFIATCATGARPTHSAYGSADLMPGEWYANVTPHELASELAAWFDRWEINVDGTDLRCVAVKQ